MSEFFEIDFLEVHTSKSGDAIAARYGIAGQSNVHVVDGGYLSTGETLTNHIVKYFGASTIIDHVVVTHPDGDHACGLRVILEKFTVRNLWMLRPWIYADHLIDRFATYQSVDHLRRRLRSLYPHLAELEDLAFAAGIPIHAPFQGSQIGAFTVLAPSPARYLDLVVNSERTPEAIEETSALAEAEDWLVKAARALANLVKKAWGEETFSPNETSAENEMSVVQTAVLCGKRIVLTGDAGREALAEAADYAPAAGLYLPGVDYFQVPHHGSRRNVSTELLDRWLGQRLAVAPPEGQGSFHAIISAATEDQHHPRKSVIRAMRHRGAKVLSTDDGRGTKCISHNAISRDGWSAAVPLSYPEEEEA